MAFLTDYLNLAGNSASISGNVTANNVAAANELTVGGAVLTAAGNTIAVNGSPLVSATGDSSISTTGNVSAGNMGIAAGGALTFGDGSTQLTAANYSNANVQAYLPTNTANVAANYFLGNGALLTGIPVSYGNANVANYLANGSDPTITALQSGVSNTNANVATLSSTLGNTNSNVSVLQGNVVTLTSDLANTNANVANLQATAYSNANVQAYLPTYTGTLSGANLTLGTSNLLLENNTIGTTADLITIDPVNDGSPLTGNVVILGNLSVTGNTITTNPVINTTNALLWEAANNAATAADATGAGMAVGPVGNNYATLTFNASRNTWNSSLGLDVTGNVSATGNVTAQYLIGNGSLLTGMYGNVQVADYLANGANPTITALQSETSNNTSNITVLQGNVTTLSSDVANLQASTYTDANVSAYLASGTNANGFSTTGNVTADVVVVKSALIADGASPAPTLSGFSTISAVDGLTTTGAISATGNLTAAYIKGNISEATGLGNIVSVNLNGNVSEVLAGDGTWVAQTGGSNYGNANVAAYLPTYNGALGNVGIANTLGVLMGTPSQGNLVSNAVSLTTTTALTDSIALLNNVLGKLVPPAPPAFPASQSLTISGTAAYRMANITQTNNTGNSLTVAAGATVNTLRTAAYTTNTIATAGPGSTGTVTAYLSGNPSGNVTLNGSSNGTYGNLIISANQDYHVANASITAGFWTVFSASLAGTAQPGWNDVAITDSAAGNTNAPSWYYDNSSPATPSFTSTAFAAGTTVTTYSSTVPHYTSATQFNVGFTVANISGNTYPTSNTFVTGTAGGAFQAPVSVNYNQSSLGSNVLPAFASANVITTSNVVAGFGSAGNVGPSVSVNNGYTTGTHAFAPGATVLYKTGSAGSLTFLDEANIFVGGTIGAGVTGTVYRIVDPGGSDTPSYSGTEAAFNSTTGPLQTYDAAVVANVLSCNKTNYSTGYLPVGPNLSAQDSTQYFTFKFVAPSTSKFDVYISGTIAGLYVALPGSGIDTSSTLNGWMDASITYAGAGQPGAGTGGNGSNGCAVGGVVPINTLMTAKRTTCTFGTTGTSASTGNEVYVRIKLTTGQSVTSLAIYPASN